MNIRRREKGILRILTINNHVVRFCRKTCLFLINVVAAHTIKSLNKVDCSIIYKYINIGGGGRVKQPLINLGQSWKYFDMWNGVYE